MNAQKLAIAVNGVFFILIGLNLESVKLYLNVTSNVAIVIIVFGIALAFLPTLIKKEIVKQSRTKKNRYFFFFDQEVTETNFYEVITLLGFNLTKPRLIESHYEASYRLSKESLKDFLSIITATIPVVNNALLSMRSASISSSRNSRKAS